MRVGEFNTTITITTITETESDGDVTQVETSETVRAKIAQIDGTRQIYGTRYLKEDELVDRVLYKIKCWDNDYNDNLKITHNGMTLYPVRPITRNKGSGSKVNEIVILAATKK